MICPPWNALGRKGINFKSFAFSTWHLEHIKLYWCWTPLAWILHQKEPWGPPSQTDHALFLKGAKALDISAAVPYSCSSMSATQIALLPTR